MLPESIPDRPTIDLSRRFPAASLPERRLAAAVLEQALLDLGRDPRSVGSEGRRGPRRPPALRARAWFQSNDERWPFSFENVCAALGLDADMIRHVIEHRSRPTA